MNGNIQ